jgi:hypothetical protein
MESKSMAEELAVGAFGAETEPQVNAEETVVAKPEGGDTDPQAIEKDGEQEHEEKKRLGGWQRKIQKLEREVQTLRQAKVAPVVEQPKPEPPKPRPTPKDFQIEGTDTYDVEKFTEALTDWKLETKLSEVEKKREEAQKQEQSKSEQQKALEAWQQKQGAAAKAKYDDYDEVIGSANVDVSPLMHEAIMSSEVGGELAYYFATHEDEAAKIARMNSYQAAKAIDKIEAQFASKEPAEQKQDKEEKEPAEPPASKAPKPPTPVSRPSAASKPFDPNDEKQAKEMTAEEWAKKRNAQVYGKRT